LRRGSPARSNSRHGRRAALRTARGRALPTAGRPVGLSFVRADGPVDAHGHRRSAMVPSDRTGAQVAAAGGPRTSSTGEARRMHGAKGPCGPRSIVCAPARSNYGAAPQEPEPERKQAQPALGLSTGCLPSCKLGPGADLAALTSQRPEAGTRLPVRHPQLAPIRLRFRHGFFGRPAGRGWYVRRGPQGRVLRHPAGPGAVRHLAACGFGVGLSTRQCNSPCQEHKHVRWRRRQRQHILAKRAHGVRTRFTCQRRPKYSEAHFTMSLAIRRASICSSVHHKTPKTVPAADKYN
jgi:hypothetical protein